MMTVELLRRIYADIGALGANLHPEFKVHAPGQNLIAGEFAGLDGLMAHLSKMQELTNSSLKLQPVSFLADDGWGMVVSQLSAERNDKRLDAQGFGVWRFQDGKIIDHWEAVSDQAHWDDFWS